MLNKFVKEIIKLPRTVIQTTAKEAAKIMMWEEDEEDEDA